MMVLVLMGLQICNFLHRDVDDRGFGAYETGAGDKYTRFNSGHLGPPPRTIEKWLQESASQDERNKFADVYESISRYDDDEKRRQASMYNENLGDNANGFAFVDHSNNKIARVVSHAPYDIANSGARGDRLSWMVGIKFAGRMIVTVEAMNEKETTDGVVARIWVGIAKTIEIETKSGVKIDMRGTEIESAIEIDMRGTEIAIEIETDMRGTEIESAIEIDMRGTEIAIEIETDMRGTEIESAIEIDMRGTEIAIEIEIDTRGAGTKMIMGETENETGIGVIAIGTGIESEVEMKGLGIDTIIEIDEREKLVFYF